MNNQWKVGRLLGEARLKAGLSKRAAADAAGISETWWRQIESGTVMKNGVAVPIEIPPATATRAAIAVQLDPEIIFAEWPQELLPSDRDDVIRERIIARIRAMKTDELNVLDAYVTGLTSRRY